MNSNVQAHIERIGKLAAAGDLCGIYTHFQNHATTYPGIPAYDEMLNQYGAFFQQEENKQSLKTSREFHSMITTINKASRANAAMLDALEKFAKTHQGTAHGKAALKAHAKMSEDSTVKWSPGRYYID